MSQAKICSEELTTDWLNEEDREMQDANIIELYRRTRALVFFTRSKGPEAGETVKGRKRKKAMQRYQKGDYENITVSHTRSRSKK
jgi:hypothetical protein